MTHHVTAIDGPAGSGKSSVSKAAAAALGLDYLDTGAAYRALSWNALEHSVDTEDAASIIASLDDFDYSIGTNPGEYYVRVEKSGYASDSAPTTMRIYPGYTSGHTLFLIIPAVAAPQ